MARSCFGGLRQEPETQRRVGATSTIRTLHSSDELRARTFRPRGVRRRLRVFRSGGRRARPELDADPELRALRSHPAGATFHSAAVQDAVGVIARMRGETAPKDLRAREARFPLAPSGPRSAARAPLGEKLPSRPGYRLGPRWPSREPQAINVPVGGSLDIRSRSARPVM
jgi:hypothetical protein